MSSEILKTDGNPWQQLVRIAMDKSVDLDKIQGLYDLAEKWEQRESAKAFGYAIQEFQRRMPTIIKSNEVRKRATAEGPGEVMYTFASYDDLLEIAQPHLTELGIVPTFTTTPAGNLITTTCRIRVGTHFEETSVTLGLPAIPNANDAQRAGAALSYGKRYALQAALNIRIKGEDTDACGLDARLDETQIQVLNQLFSDCRDAGNEVDPSRFWSWIGCTDMNDMKPKDFPRAVDFLNRKRKAVKK